MSPAYSSTRISFHQQFGRPRKYHCLRTRKKLLIPFFWSLLLIQGFHHQARAQNSVPTLDNAIHSNPAAAGFRTRVSVNLVSSSYRNEESYFGNKAYETEVQGNQGSLGLSGSLLKTELGYSTSSSVRRDEKGKKIATTNGRTPLFQGALVLGNHLSLGAGYLRSDIDYQNMDNTTLNSIRTIERVNAGTVLNFGPVFLGYFQFVNNYLETPTTVGFSRKGLVGSIGLFSGSSKDNQGVIEYARTMLEPVKADSTTDRSGVDLGEVSGYSFSFTGIVRGFLISLYRGEQTFEQSFLFVEILDEYKYSVSVIKLGYQPSQGFSFYISAVRDESEMSFRGLYQTYFGNQYYESKGSGTSIGLGYTF